MVLKGQRFAPKTRTLAGSECPPGSGDRGRFSSMEDSEGPFSSCLLDTEMQTGAWLKQRLDEGLW